MERDTLLEKSMDEIHKQNYERVIRERTIVGNQTNWRNLGIERQRKVLSGYSKILLLLNRAVK